MKPRKPFKFINALVDMSEFLALVEGFWSETVPLYNYTLVFFSLSRNVLKAALRELSKEKVRDIFKKIREAYKNLCEAQVKTLEDPGQINMKAEPMRTVDGCFYQE